MYASVVAVAVDDVAAVHGRGAASCHGGRHRLARPLVCLVSCSFLFIIVPYLVFARHLRHLFIKNPSWDGIFRCHLKKFMYRGLHDLYIYPKVQNVHISEKIDYLPP